MKKKKKITERERASLSHIESKKDRILRSESHSNRVKSLVGGSVRKYNG